LARTAIQPASRAPVIAANCTVAIGTQAPSASGPLRCCNAAGPKNCEDVKLPGGKILFPGAVSHSTDLVEHPEPVADRLITFAEIVGRENLIAGTDCGLGGRVHRQIARAKLRALRDGAAIASKTLWS
jgi:hypothetical protein